MTPGPAAWHEAGHAFAAYLLGGRVREVTLESEEDGLEGHVAVEWDRTADPRSLAMVALAGPVAELALRGQSALEDLSTWRADWDEAQAQLERLHRDPLEREATSRALLAELHAAFEDGYERLARIADALDAHGTLDETLFEDAVG